MKIIKKNPSRSVIHTLTMACHIANHEFKPVMVEINDVILYVDDRISLDNLWKKYQEKLNFKFEIERLKRAKQK